MGLFWYHSPDAKGPFYQAAGAAWREVAPHLFAETQASWSQRAVDSTVPDIDGSGFFGPVSVRQYDWILEYTTQEYVRLLRTYSLVRCLPVKSQREALERIADLVEENGGSVKRPYTTLLYVTRVQKDRPS